MATSDMKRLRKTFTYLLTYLPRSGFTLVHNSQVVSKHHALRLANLEERIASIQLKHDAANAPNIARLRPTYICKTHRRQQIYDTIEHCTRISWACDFVCMSVCLYVCICREIYKENSLSYQNHKDVQYEFHEVKRSKVTDLPSLRCICTDRQHTASS